MNDKSRLIFKAVITALIAALTAVGAIFGLNSCNVTRKVTTESSYFTSGDTTTTIVTKTVESYDASKKLY